MNHKTLLRTLGWCTVINYVILMVWFVVFFVAHDWLRELHTRFGFHLSPDQFDFANYFGMAIYKIGIMLFNLVPYLALRIARRDSDVKSALRYLDTILAVNPDAPSEHMLRAAARFQLGNREGALEDVDWILDHQPENINLERVREFRKMLERRER